jgi:DNA replication and repair protein RecF
MYLSSLQLLNYKNLDESHLEFSENINLITGRNGSGKTNLLDAIHFVLSSRSATSSSDYQAIRHDQEFLLLKAALHIGNELKNVHLSMQNDKGRSIRVNDSVVSKLKDYYGMFPVVFISPDDIDIINLSSETRRRFFNSILSFLSKDYLAALIDYNHVLKQRNAFLKNSTSFRDNENLLLDNYDKSLIGFGKTIWMTRLDFLKKLKPILNRIYSKIIPE